MQDTKHKSVLTEEVIQALDIKPSDTIIDATLGAGGHAMEIAKRLGEKGRLIALDLDPNSIERLKEQIVSKGSIELVEENFRAIDRIVQSADGIVFDLGWNSDQFEGSGRGFSFQEDEPLDMRYSDKNPLSAKEIVNEWQESSIADILYGYGEERAARKIAAAIVSSRENHAIQTTGELREIVERSVPVWYRAKRIHPATKTFQALRIAVNDELGALAEALPKAVRILKPQGRLAVITFHSLEDRIVKRYFKEAHTNGIGTILTKKPIIPSPSELQANPRARSAKLRILEKT